MDAVWQAIKEVMSDNQEFNDIEYKFRFNVCEHFNPGEEENQLVHTNIHHDFQNLLDESMDYLLVQ